MNGHIEEMVPLGPPLQREEGPAPATIEPAEAQIEEVVAPGTPQAQLQNLLVPRQMSQLHQGHHLHQEDQ